MNPQKYRKFHNECEKCSSSLDLLVHHIDHNRNNNTLENFQVVCTSCHALIHRRIKNIKKMRRFYMTLPNQLVFEFFR